MNRSLIAALVVAPMIANAQAWSISGSVVDKHDAPVADVRIEIQGTFQRAISGADGSFALAVARGDSVVLLARRLGYVPVEITARRAAGAPVRITMELVPLQLSGVVVPGDVLAPQSQTVTRESVRNLPALGEADILRVLPFLGAVSQPNDFMSAAHLAGAATDETSMSLDGHPVQSPVHLGGMFSGINVSAIERVDVFAAHAPFGYPTRLGGLLDIRSRRADTRSREVVVSVLSSGLTVVEPEVIGKVSMLASGRLTYADRVLKLLRVRSGGDEIPLPSYMDGLLRLDIPVTSRLKVEPLLLATHDSRNRGRSVTTVNEALAGLSAVHTGTTWISEARISSDAFSIGNDDLTQGVKLIDVRQRWSSASLGSSGVAGGFMLSGRVALDWRDHHLAWRNGRKGKDLGGGLPDTSNENQRQRLLFGGVEASRHLSRAFIVSAGTRAYGNAGKLFTAPAFRAQWSHRSLTLVGSADRRYQFDGVYGPAVEETVAQPVFLFKDPRWSDGGAITAKVANQLRSIELSGFARKTYERPIGHDTRAPSPYVSEPPGFSLSAGRVIGTTATASAVASRGTNLQLSYTFQRVYTRGGGDEWPSDWDIPNSLALFTGVPLAKKWSLTGAFQWHSGLPTTPIASLTLVPSPTSELGGHDRRLIFGDSNAARLPSYRRLDLGVRRTWMVGRAEWSFTGQVINAMGTRNAFGYHWDQYVDVITAGGKPHTHRPGLPILPSVGVTVRW